MAKPAVVRKPKDVSAPVETKEQKLLRLASKRVSKACKYISLIGNLAAYKPTPSDVDRIMSALGEHCAYVDNRLRGSKSTETAFTLREIQPSH